MHSYFFKIRIVETLFTGLSVPSDHLKSLITRNHISKASFLNLVKTLCIIEPCFGSTGKHPDFLLHCKSSPS